MKSLPFITSLILLLTTPPAWASLEPEANPVRRALPFTLETLQDGSWAKDEADKPMAFRDIVLPGLSVEFTQYWSTMLSGKFPSPPAHHRDENIIKGMKCLFDRMKAVLGRDESDERKVVLQRFELNKTLAFHKKQLQVFNLGDQVPDVGCSKCIAEAMGQMGMEDHGYQESEEESEGK